MKKKANLIIIFLLFSAKGICQQNNSQGGLYISEGKRNALKGITYILILDTVAYLDIIQKFEVRPYRLFSDTFYQTHSGYENTTKLIQLQDDYLYVKNKLSEEDKKQKSVRLRKASLEDINYWNRLNNRIAMDNIYPRIEEISIRNTAKKIDNKYLWNSYNELSNKTKTLDQKSFLLELKTFEQKFINQ